MPFCWKLLGKSSLLKSLPGDKYPLAALSISRKLGMTDDPRARDSQGQIYFVFRARDISGSRALFISRVCIIVVYYLSTARATFNPRHFPPHNAPEICRMMPPRNFRPPSKFQLTMDESHPLPVRACLSPPLILFPSPLCRTCSRVVCHRDRRKRSSSRERGNKKKHRDR